MRIGDSQLEDIRSRTDIVELVREYVPALKQAGRNFKACCPFHQEKTPSFMVNPEKQIYHCFGCQAGGDAFSFVMQLEGLAFPEAVRKLAERAGVKIEAAESASPEERERGRIKGALDFARAFYRDQLLKSPEAQPARAYLAKRGVSAEAGERFALGYAPRAGGLLAAAARKGFEPGLLARAGLAAQRQGQQAFRDYFWGRILFPILNAKGETAGFGARAMGDAEPKYLNSPDGPMFSKGRVLYGLHEGLAALRKARRALVLEGYMDVIALHQFGLANACAPLGTALTEEHVALLKRYADEAVLVFDPDAAGAAASLRGAEMLLAAGLTVRIATLPDGLDPDELLHRGGVPALQASLDKALDLPAYSTEVALAGRQAKALSPEERSRIAARVLAVIRRASDSNLRADWLGRLADRLGLDQQALAEEFRRGSEAPLPKTRAKPVLEPKWTPAPISAGEELVLLALFRHPAPALDDASVAESDFASGTARALFAAIRAAAGEGTGPDWTARCLAKLGGAEAAKARAILCDNRELRDPAAEVARQIGRMRKMRRLSEIEPLLHQAGSGVPAGIFEEYRKLRSELQGSAARKGE